MEALVSQPVATTVLLATVLVSCIYNVYLVIYRLWFSPVAKFPGPKFAAASFWYEFYYDYWLDGKYLFEVEKMHKKYGSHGDRFLDDPDFASDWFNIIHAIVRSIPLFTGFPQLIQFLSLLPESLLLWIYPKGQMFNIFRQRALQQIRLANNDQSKEDSNGVSIFRHIANSDMPEEERTEERLAKEAQVLLGGGTASTARTIGFASYYILSRPELRSKLEAELKEPMANWPESVPSWAELEQLPLLQAIIKESLRLSYGVMHRLPRVFPDQPIQYKDYVIPIGVPVGMSALAMAEMSLVLAVLYRSNGPKLELYETDESDVKQAHDFLIPLPKLSTKGVRALIR
ncbi:hypothetical protein TrVFT333_003688 [Trichoderma virens FT-333]|nr:hypothetical protein TrVFT333_003688 [Trichoderma virens FT-333]